MDRYAPHARPPADKIPGELTELIAERDKIAERANAARRRVDDLADQRHDLEAEKADRDAATAAARAGKPIPPPTAVPELAEGRDQAKREAEAQRAALAAVVADLSTACYNARAALEESEAKRRTAVRTKIEKQAEQLAEAVDQEKRDRAVFDWLAGRPLDRNRATAHFIDVLPELGGHGAAGLRDPHHLALVGDAIRNAARAALTEETDR
ncbi:hypothetical protein [Pseudonocardia acidicola]|uniref:Uncharacterized protein n=1 Tax=Pseudonocardia acidicola TaxID=2724939 RepID=A0ABX1SK13_9PSEU|nr:hypothetical protein [Pseudonocardia acidicola]NMI00727.1 hypothetical protein [Pseudonocardia acidicola]